ncbi:MAG TPA: tetratricopeptide repeat protein, partial [Methanothrix sp.]|nr:tetratricopeptide repeat protein [Methanothrix sp.]
MTSTLPSRELLNELKLAEGKNSLIFAITEDREGLSQLLKSNNFDIRSIDLRDNGNLFQMLVEWEHTPNNAVFLIYGISSQFPSVLGYLNLHRDLFYHIKRPVLMALSEYELREIQKHAPDLYRYRSRTYNLKAKKDIGIRPIFSDPKSVYYKLPILEEKIDVDAIRERIKLDEYMLGSVTDDYKKAELYMDLAISYFKLDDFGKGNDFLRESMDIRRQQNDEKGILLNYRRLVRVFYLKKQFRKIIELSSQLLRMDPTSDENYFYSGLAYGGLGQSETALECFEKAIELDPKNSCALSNKGATLNNLKRYEDALISSEKAIELDPNNSHAWLVKGYALFGLKRYEDALKSLEKALDIDPKNSHAWSIKGSILNNLGRYEDALRSSEKAIELDPKNSHAWYVKGVALNDLKRYDDALKSL